MDKIVCIFICIQALCTYSHQASLSLLHQGRYNLFLQFSKTHNFSQQGTYWYTIYDCVFDNFARPKDGLSL